MNSLSRKKANRKSLLRNLATSLILYEKIKTTEAKAKAVKPVVEKLITKAKKNDLASRRLLLAYLFDSKAVKKTFEVLVPRYQKLSSGFIKVYKIGPRLGDASPIVILELAPARAEPAKEIVNKEKNAEKNSSKEKSAPGVKA